VSEAKRQAEARILAGTLTLLAREEENLPAPYALWNRPLNAAQIKETALKAASGLARAVWVDDSYPARGLLIMTEQSLETVILGWRSLRLTGPWLMEPDPAERQAKTAVLARKAVSGETPPFFMAVKTIHDPAVIRGFEEAGFQTAEISSCLSGPLRKDLIPDFPFVRHTGLTLKNPGPEEGGRWLDQLGELFYDGHYLHGPCLPADFSAKLWQSVGRQHLAQGHPVLFLWEEYGQRPAAMAMAQVWGSQAHLLALHVTEDRRGEGLGRLVLLEMERLLVRQQVQTLSAETASWNLPALRLYQGLGLSLKAPLITLHCQKLA
jgi:GNAT superfamily N-acetyltransferase